MDHTQAGTGTHAGSQKPRQTWACWEKWDKEGSWPQDCVYIEPHRSGRMLKKKKKFCDRLRQHFFGYPDIWWQPCSSLLILISLSVPFCQNINWPLRPPVLKIPSAKRKHLQSSRHTSLPISQNSHSLAQIFWSICRFGFTYEILLL